MLEMRNDTELVICRLEPQMTAEFEQMVQIYTEALPESERKGEPDLRAMQERRDYEFLIASLGETVVGFSIVVELSPANACLLEYMAVLRTKRGLGIGRSLFFSAAGSKLATSRYMLLEVDSDKEEDADRATHKRRKEFYRGLGCREVKGLSYRMPLVTSMTPPAMDLLVYQKELPAEIEKVLLWQWLERIYVKVYRQSAGDIRINEMLAPLPNKVELV
jgi:ribosomal protein S18 acetylase RimI-like enzyme